jgi:hypothetical protein
MHNGSSTEPRMAAATNEDGWILRFRSEDKPYEPSGRRAQVNAFFRLTEPKRASRQHDG